MFYWELPLYHATSLCKLGKHIACPHAFWIVLRIIDVFLSLRVLYRTFPEGITVVRRDADDASGAGSAKGRA
jgi:hypothetical protein